jgi:NADH-quinone oxidoreductase subunit A
MTPVSIAAYLALFAGAGLSFLFINLLVGKFVRPADPHAEKLEVYECGEPTIGSSFVQFDLRFYVVALLFIIFDVEIAFFFPWANVYGKANQLRDERYAVVAQQQASDSIARPIVNRTDDDRRLVNQRAEAVMNQKFEELGVVNATPEKILANPAPGFAANRDALKSLGTRMAAASLVDIGVFFAVLMVGFFYVWRRGDLDWVRALAKERAATVEREPLTTVDEEVPALSA